jgi:hypothetical protein
MGNNFTPLSIGKALEKSSVHELPNHEQLLEGGLP